MVGETCLRKQYLKNIDCHDDQLENICLYVRRQQEYYFCIDIRITMSKTEVFS